MPHAILKQSLTFTMFLLYSYKAMKLLIHVIIKINRHLLGIDESSFKYVFEVHFLEVRFLKDKAKDKA